MLIKVEDLNAVVTELRYGISAKEVKVSIREEDLANGQLVQVLMFHVEPTDKTKYDGTIYCTEHQLEIFSSSENRPSTRRDVTVQQLKPFT
jgi:hypothetical protein